MTNCKIMLNARGLMNKLLAASFTSVLIVSIGCAPAKQQSTRPANISPEPAPKVSVVDENANIPVPSDPVQKARDLQQMLKDLGYQPGPVDGVPGKQTFAALTAFQTDRNLIVTNEVTEEAYKQVYTAVTKLLASTLNSGSRAAD